MARIRSLKPGFCTSEDIAQLTIPCRLHFAMLWTYADDEGRGADNPRLIKGALWPLDDHIDHDAINAFHDELEQAQRIVRYEVDGRRYFQINDFTKHQHPTRPVKSVLPAPPTALEHCANTVPTVRQHPRSSRGVVVGELPPVPPTVVRNPRIDSTIPPQAAAAVFDKWIEATGRSGRTRLDHKRRRLITNALAAYPLEDVLDAVQGWRNSPHHRGDNDRGTTYNDLELLLRDAAHIERFRDLNRQTTKRPAAHAVGTPKPMTDAELAALEGRTA